MNKKNLPIKKIIQLFDLKIISAGRNIDEKFVLSPGLTHIGLALASEICVRKTKNIVLLGMGEKKYLQSLNDEQKKMVSRRINAMNPPLLLLTNSFTPEDAKWFVSEFDLPELCVCHTKWKSDEIYLFISPYIAKILTDKKTIHGTLINVYGTGVLLTGNSGIGKSELALDMVRNGHFFVGDDAINIYRFGDKVYGYPNAVAKKFIEVRGLGILSIDHMFGIEKILDETEINIVLHLESQEKKYVEFERIGDVQRLTQLDGVSVAYYVLPIAWGRNLNNLVESAVIDYKMRLNGYNSAKEYLKNYNQIIKEKE